MATGNFAIALGARAPQGNGLSSAIQQNAQMINMLTQQRAAERQNALAQQRLQLEQQLAVPQLAEAQAKAHSAQLEYTIKAVGHALHSSVSNPTDATLDAAAATLTGLGLDSATVDREISPIKQLPFEQRKPALLQSILSDANSKAAYMATLPKQKQVTLGDKVITIDENPLSPTYNQQIRSDQVGVSPNTIYTVAHPNLAIKEGEGGGFYGVNPKTGTAQPVLVGGSRGGGASAAGTYGPSIESAATQAVPGVNVTSRQRSAAHNAAVGGVSNSYHLTDNARDFVPPSGMSMTDLHAKLKQTFGPQGFDVLNEGSHVHVEPGANMHAAPAAGKQLYGKAAKGTEATTEAADETKQRKEALANEFQHVYDLVTDPSNAKFFQSKNNSWFDNQAQDFMHGQRNEKTHEFGVHTSLPGGVAHKTMWDEIEKSISAVMRLSLAKGQASTDKALGSQMIHLRSLGLGNNPSLETLKYAIENAAADKGVTLRKRGAAPAASSLPDDIRRQYGL